MNTSAYTMFIFVKMQNCVKRQTDTCFPVQNTQRKAWICDRLYKGSADTDGDTPVLVHRGEVFIPVREGIGSDRPLR